MPYCPNCKSEYVEGTTKCADCDVLLVPGPPPSEEEEAVDNQELVPVYYPKDEVEAKIVRGALEAEGIRAWEAADLTTEMFPFDVDTLGTDAIGVLASDVERAKDVIREALEIGEEIPLDEEIEVEGTPPED